MRQEPLEDSAIDTRNAESVNCVNNVCHTDNAEVCHHCHFYDCDTQVIMLIV